MMLEVAANPEVTEAPLPASVADRHRAPVKAPSRHQATHWTRHLHDPLGAALLSLQKTRTALDALDAAAPSWTKPAEVVAAEILPEDNPSESLPQILPLGGFHVVDETTLVTTGDRRRFPRRQSECMVTVLERRQTDQLTPQQIDRWLQAGRSVGRLLDISQAGLCLLLDREIAKDTEVLLRISNQQLNRHIDCTATVVHSHLTGQGRFSIHCRVLNEFTLSDLQDLGRPLAVGHVLA